MTPPRLRRARLGAAAAGLLSIAVVAGLGQLPATAGTAKAAARATVPASTIHRPAFDPDNIATLGDAVPGLTNLDVRGKALPTALQRRAATRFHAVNLRWNQFGTPDSILPASGVLASGFSKNPDQAPGAARQWIMANRDAFGFSAAQVGALTLVNNQVLAHSPARAVLFRQNFGTLSPALDSMITVGVSHGEIDYASSSITRATDLSALKDKTITPLQGWLAAAANIGRAVPAAAAAKLTSSVTNGWTSFNVPGFANLERARMRSLAMADGTVVPVVEADVVDVQGGSSTAYTEEVNALSGRVLFRVNDVDNDNDAAPMSGSITPTACGPRHQFQLGNDATRTLVGTAAMANAADGVVARIFSPDGALLAASDGHTTPAAATAVSATGFPAGIYSFQVCPQSSGLLPERAPFNYAASVNALESAGSRATGPTSPPRWRYFVSTPTLGSINASTPHNSVVACWFSKAKGCSYPLGALRNVQAPGPWDTDPDTGQSTLTTIGNNANTHEAWLSPLTPGGTEQAPVDSNRSYTAPFTDAWNNSKCNPGQLHTGGNDIDASVTDLFVTHNLMHDYSYYLGFTEKNYNDQLSNLSRGGVAGDQETGNAQAGAIDGGYPSFEGRDNANQIAEQDGVPGITNQYLFQPIAGSFYAPCTDGALDFGIVGHEYTHEISNRMVGGPDENIEGSQGGAMGESWSDLNAAEFLFSHGYTNGGDIFAVGIYATQNKTVAIRDYSIDHNPLNYSDLGFDIPGPEVHADGELWNGTQWSVRQALVNKYNKQFPYRNKQLQRRCSNAATNGSTSSPLPVSQCPGNRRWIQLIYDAWLMQPGEDSMLTARDTMLAADRMRFGGRDLKAMWKAFASRGMGYGAVTKSADDEQPTPSFSTPTSYSLKPNATVTFKSGVFGKVYVGDYEAGVTPVADTNTRTKLGPSVKFTPGTYDMMFVSQSRGAYRFKLTVRPGKNQVVRFRNPRNLASKFLGAKIIGSTPGSLNVNSLIDGTEATDYAAEPQTYVNLSHPYITVKLVGGVSTIRRANVSAYLHAAPTLMGDLGVLVGPANDPYSGSRFTALRQFALEACVKDCSSKNAKWHRFYTSKPNAFPATLPRPVAPDINLRTFRFKPVRAAAVKLVILNNQCTGNKQYSGEQDSDPTNNTDCKTGSGAPTAGAAENGMIPKSRGLIAHVAELQIFTR